MLLILHPGEIRANFCKNPGKYGHARIYTALLFCYLANSSVTLRALSTNARISRRAQIYPSDFSNTIVWSESCQWVRPGLGLTSVMFKVHNTCIGDGSGDPRQGSQKHPIWNVETLQLKTDAWFWGKLKHKGRQMSNSNVDFPASISFEHSLQQWQC